MKSEWKTLTIQELIDGNMLEEPLDGNHGGIHPKSSDYVETGIPFIMASDLHGGIVNYRTCKFISEKQAKTLRKGFAQPGDVLLTHKATLGRTAIVDASYETIILTPQVTYYRVKKGLHNKYLKYYFDSIEFQLLLSNWAASGSTRHYLGITAQKKLPVRLPPLPEQRAIAATLSCLDDKIELNNKINANLEAQAQAIFKSWFVDFEPFQDGEFVDSELGRIPKGWRVGTLDEIADITMGQSPNGSSYNENEEGMIFFQGRAEFGWRFPTVRLYTTEPKRLAKENDILMSVRAPVGDINAAHEDCCIGRGLAAIQSKNNAQSFLLYLMMDLHAKLDAYNGEGTVFGSINQKALKSMQIVIPPSEEIRKYEQLCSSYDSQIRFLSDQSRTLAALRDALLPKLMSGEIEVPTAEKIISERS